MSSPSSPFRGTLLLGAALLLTFVVTAAGCPCPTPPECSYNSDCASPLVCRSGTCAAECKAEVDCLDGYACVDSRCRRSTPDVVDAGTSTPGCHYNSECSEPFLCIEGTCRAECLRTVDCAEDYVCRESRCVRGGGGTGGGNTDAGTTDAGTTDAGTTDAGTTDAGTSGPSCTNRIKDGTETDVDCGGTCGKCGDSQACQSSSDCASGACQSNVCVATQPLTLTLTGSGSGTVTSSPAGISCGGTCQARFASGTSVSLTATPSANATFTGWSGGGCSGTGTCNVTLTSATTVTATFTLQATGSLDWQKLLGGDHGGGWDYGQDTAFDGSGNVVFAAYSRSTLDFGGGPLTPYGSSDDIFVAKFTSAGSHLWSRRFGDINSDYTYAVGTNTAGDVFLSGTMGSQFSVGGSLLPCSNGIFLAKYASANGTHLWSFCVSSGYPYPIIQGLAVDANGDVYISGIPQGADFGGGALNGAIFVAKYSGADGSHVWSKAFGTGGAAFASLKVDSSGNVLIAGSFSGTLQLGTATLTSVGNQDIFVARLNSTGSHVWSKRFGDSYDDVAQDVAVDAAGNVLVTGSFRGSVDFGGGPVTSAGEDDGFLLKLAGSNGAYQWARRFGGALSDQAQDVAAGPDGVVAMTGHFQSNTLDLGTGPLTNQGSWDIFVAKYAADGTPMWSTTPASSATYDYAYGIALDSSGAASVTGLSSGKLLLLKLAP